MDSGPNALENPEYTDVLASLANENEATINDALHAHSLENESNFTSEMVAMDELTIVTSNGKVSGRLASRILAGELASITTPKTLELDPEELLEPDCLIEEQPLKLKSNSILNHSCKTAKWKEIQLRGNRFINRKQNTFFSKVDPANHILTDNVNPDLNNVINLSLNRLPLQSTNNTAVEQPNIGPCSCFICGLHLLDPGERCSYMKTQKLFSLKISLLQLLSDIVNQTIITNTDSIDLCLKCSELMNEVDTVYKHLNDLKEKISKLFTINRRPKLTFQILPKLSSVISKNFIIKNPKEVNLSELAYTRPRRRGSKKKNPFKNEVTNQIILEKEKPAKRKGGRPRKPFQCHICKRKFLTQTMNDKHLMKEHNVTPNNASITPVLQTIKPSCELAIGTNSHEAVKQENVDEEKYSNERSDIVIGEGKPELLSFMQQTMASLPSASPRLTLNYSNTSGVHSAVRPIQPKPQTVVHTDVDGSLMFFMNPTTSDGSPTLIKISPNYMNLKTGSHNCELCHKSFLDDKGYKMHKIAAHGIRKRKLDYEEGSEVSSGKGEKDDMVLQKFWQCDLCHAMFSSKKLLSNHRKLLHETTDKGLVSRDTRKDKVYSCDDCEQMFNYKYEMESHKETHLPFNQVGPHEFVCCLCGLKVASKAALKIHLHRFHNKEEDTKDFLCAECGYMTGTKKAFSDHLRIHNENPGQKKECHLCQKEMLPSSYKIHMLRMHGEAKYPCETCGQRFTVRSDLMKHLNTIHSSLRPYDCPFCGEKFATSEALRYHKNKVHSTVFHFCEVCGKSYKWKGELRTHINRCHSESKMRFQCNLCSRNYTDRRKLCYHINSKHNASKVVSNIRKFCDEKAMGSKMMGDDIVPSTLYEPQGTLISTPETLTSITCSTQAEVSLPLVTGEDTLSTLQSYDHAGEQTTLTTLHSHVPLHVEHDPNNPHSHHQHGELHRQFHHEDNSPSITHFSHLHHPSKLQALLSQPLSTTPLISMHPKDTPHLGPTEVQSIYLVPDIETVIQAKNVETT